MAEPEASAGPRWRRRKTARPGEIADAALHVFAEKGFAAARLEEVAARAGVSKAALYLYFPTKADLFRAVAEQAAGPAIGRLGAMAAVPEARLEFAVPLILARLAELAQGSQLGGVVKMVIGESRNFPDLARVWHDAVASQGLALLTRLVEQAQARGEARPGDPRLFALSIMGPMLMGVLWCEVFTPVGGGAIDLRALAAQHATTVLGGLIAPRQAAA